MSLERSELIFPRMVELRRTIHRHPELAFEEVETAKLIMEELESMGIPYEYEGKGNAVIGKLESGDEGAPAVALRAEMDALPATENTGLPFTSEVPGRMHACGHDGHMAMVLGAASLLKVNPPEGNVLFVFQPAEERGGGARVVLKSGALTGIKAIFAGHVTHHYRVGEIMINPGVVTAQSDRFTVRIKGKGGHGARPHEAIDAVVITGMLISNLQTLVSREINPVYPSVITVGRIQAGSAANVIAEDAVLEGTIRTTLPEVRDHLFKGIERMTKAMGECHNAKIDVEFSGGYPPVVNSSREAEIACTAAEQVVGKTGIVSMEYPSMGSEDFSFYLQELPGCYVRFGARIQEEQYIPLHSPLFDINEEVLKVGAAFFDQVAREALREYGQK